MNNDKLLKQLIEKYDLQDLVFDSINIAIDDLDQIRYIEVEKNNCFAIYDIRKKEYITDFHHFLHAPGLLSNLSDHILIINHYSNDQKFQLVNAKTKKKSQEFDFIYSQYILDRESDYYTAHIGKAYDMKVAIFDQDHNQITSWLNIDDFQKVFMIERYSNDYWFLNIKSNNPQHIMKRLKFVDFLKNQKYIDNEVKKFILDCYKKGYILHKLKGYEKLLNIFEISRLLMAQLKKQRLNKKIL